MNHVFKKQKKTTLAQQARRTIRKAIESGKLKPGEKIAEPKLARQMGISRFPIREALRSLEKEGLVTSESYKGTYVSQTSERDIYELYSLRELLEDFALLLLMADLNDSKVKVLESVLASMKQAARAQNHEKILLEDFNFHRKICELSGHNKLLTVWLNLKRQIMAFLALEKPLFSTPNDYVATHDPVMKAIKSGETEKARKALKQHLDLAYNNLVQRIKQRRAS